MQVVDITVFTRNVNNGTKLANNLRGKDIMALSRNKRR